MLFGASLAILALAVYFAIQHSSRATTANVVPPTPNQPKEAPATSARPVYTQDEMRAFLGNVLMPLLHSARQEYPVVSVRESMEGLMARIERHEILLVIQPVYMGGGLARSGMSQDGRPMLEIILPAAMQFHEETGRDTESFQDEMIATVLHEQYHIDHHFKAPLPATQAESEAWAYTIREVYLPMSKAGRLKQVDSTAGAGILSYHACGGDTNHRAWQAFIGTVTSPY